MKQYEDFEYERVLHTRAKAKQAFPLRKRTKERHFYALVTVKQNVEGQIEMD